MTRTPNLRARSGFSLVELMVAMIMLLMVMGSAVAVLRSQNRAFIRGSDDTMMFQSTEFATSTVERTLRTLGANVVGQQPMLVYGDATVVAFNADFVERDEAPIRWAVNYNPDALPAEVNAWDLAARGTIPNSTYQYPSETYRLRNGTESPAETIIFYLQADAGTPRGDDFVLYQRTNAGTAQVVSRNILAFPGRPFFQYFLRNGTAGLQLAGSAQAPLPLIRRPLSSAGSAADSVVFQQPDSVRAVRFNLRVTNGRTGAEERIREVSTMVELPNNGLPQPTTCGRAPYGPQNLQVVLGPAGSGELTLRWERSTDHGAGENDVRQYAIYERPGSSVTPPWPEPLFSVRADAGTTYEVLLADRTPGQTYTFGVASQDCTPQFSPIASLTRTLP